MGEKNFLRKRYIEYDFPPPLYVGGKLKKNATQIVIFLPHYMWAETKRQCQLLVPWIEIAEHNVVVNGPWTLGLGTADQFGLSPEQSHQLAPHQSAVHATLTVAEVEVKRLLTVLVVEHVVHKLLQVLDRTVLVAVVWKNIY